MTWKDKQSIFAKKQTKKRSKPQKKRKVRKIPSSCKSKEVREIVNQKVDQERQAEIAKRMINSPERKPVIKQN